MEIFEIYGRNIFKMSMGYIWKISRSLVTELETRHWIVMGANTGKNQVPEFRNARINDLVYVCYGSEHLSFLAEIVSDVRIFPDDLDEQIGVNGDWIYREVRILHQPINYNLKDLTSNKLGYMPSGNSTFYRIPQDQIQNANRLLFEPKYDIHFVNSEIEDNSTTNLNTDFMEKLQLNTILYGPPGTGKTYLLQNNYFPLFKVESSNQTIGEYESEIISKLSWWQVIALILLEKNKLSVPDMKEHRFTKYKLAVSNTKSINQTFWGQLSAHTIEDSKTVDYTKRSNILVFNKEEKDSIWYIVEDMKSKLFDLVEILNDLKNYQPKTNNKNNYSFITFHQSYAYEDFVIGIKPILESDNNEQSGEISYCLEKGKFYKACDEASKLAGFLSVKDAIENYSKEERINKFKVAKAYGLFIDEINRGNVSSIFGELITLIEDDKRLGTENELILDIPNSENFGVPSNLYIIGTMNTADRSVETLDTALRRRFSFVEMLPDPTKLIDVNNQPLLIKDINLQDLLFTINKRIEFLVDRDHTIGHAFFIGLDSPKTLKSIFKNKIIPLLQEYFYGNYYNIELVLGSGFFHKKEKSKVTFAIDSSEVESDGYIYDFKDLDKLDDDKFIQLLKEIKLESFSLQE